LPKGEEAFRLGLSDIQLLRPGYRVSVIRQKAKRYNLKWGLTNGIIVRDRAEERGYLHKQFPIVEEEKVWKMD
jgi:hypothetical protein